MNGWKNGATVVQTFEARIRPAFPIRRAGRDERPPIECTRRTGCESPGLLSRTAGTGRHARGRLLGCLGILAPVRAEPKRSAVVSADDVLCGEVPRHDRPLAADRTDAILGLFTPAQVCFGFDKCDVRGSVEPKLRVRRVSVGYAELRTVSRYKAFPQLLSLRFRKRFSDKKSVRKMQGEFQNDRGVL